MTEGTIPAGDYELHTDPKAVDKALLDRLVDPDLPPIIYRPDPKIKGVEIKGETTQIMLPPAELNFMEFFPKKLPEGPTIVPFGFGWAIVHQGHIKKLFRWRWMARRHLRDIC